MPAGRLVIPSETPPCRGAQRNKCPWGTTSRTGIPDKHLQGRTTLSAQTARSAVIPSQCAPRSKCPWGTHWRGNPSPSAALPRCRDVGNPSPTRGSTYRPVGRGPCAPPKNAYPAAGHMGPALQVHTPQTNNAAPLAGRRAFSVHVWHRRRRVIFAAFTSGNRGG